MITDITIPADAKVSFRHDEDCLIIEDGNFGSGGTVRMYFEDDDTMEDMADLLSLNVSANKQSKEYEDGKEQS